MDAKVREEVETAVRALEEALGGLFTFMMTLRPTLRNEILQICGHHLERARQAKERLDAMVKEQSGAECPLSQESTTRPEAGVPLPQRD